MKQKKKKVNKVQFDCTQPFIKYIKPLHTPLAFDGPIFIFISLNALISFLIPNSRFQILIFKA